MGAGFGSAAGFAAVSDEAAGFDSGCFAPSDVTFRGGVDSGAVFATASELAVGRGSGFGSGRSVVECDAGFDSGLATRAGSAAALASVVEAGLLARAGSPAGSGLGPDRVLATEPVSTSVFAFGFDPVPWLVSFCACGSAARSASVRARGGRACSSSGLMSVCDCCGCSVVCSCRSSLRRRRRPPRLRRLRAGFFLPAAFDSSRCSADGSSCFCCPSSCCCAVFARAFFLVPVFLEALRFVSRPARFPSVFCRSSLRLRLRCCWPRDRPSLPAALRRPLTGFFFS